MANSKVIFGNETLIDLTQDDVTPADVRSGVYFHTKAGVRTVGSASIGGGYQINIFTEDSVLYGYTITISKDGATVGTTVFDDTGNAEFAVNDTGLYTVSVTYSGQTFTDTVDVVNEFDSVINAIPDGSTVTPVNDIQTWLHCGNVWDKNYTTLAAVLADTTTLLALISSQNAVDYMVRSHDWCDDVCADATAMTYIGANNYAADTLLADDNSGLVPIMTSDTTPSGRASARSVLNSSSLAFYAFDGSLSNRWHSGNGYSSVEGEYLEYDFDTPVCVKKVVVNHTQREFDMTAKFQAYDGTSWQDLSDTITIVKYTVNSFDINNDTLYSKYRLYFLTSGYYSGSYNYAIVDILQFYAKDGSWLESICNSTYFESVLNTKVPAMTSNTTPSGTAGASSVISGDYQAWKAFIGYNTSNLTSWIAGTSDAYIFYDFERSVLVKYVHFENRNYSADQNGRITSFKIQGSDTGTSNDWHDVTDIIQRSITSVTTPTNVMLAGNTKYRYWALHGLTAQTAYTGAAALQFYGRTDV